MKNTNNAFSVLSETHSPAVVALITALTLAVTAFTVKAQTYPVSISDSTLQLNLTGGLTGWTAGGVNQLANQWYYYSIGSGVENPINTIFSPSVPTFSGLALGGRIIDTNLTTTYANSSISLTTSYTLQLQGSGSTLNSAITIENLSGTNRTIQFYQLSDFSLGGVSGGQTIQFLQTGNPYGLSQTGNGGTLSVTSSGLTGGTSDSVEEMAGSGNFGLGTGNPAPTFNDSSLTASGNVDFAYEFIATIAPGSSVTINELETVPEPSSMALISAGVLVVGLLRKRGFALFKK